MAQKIILMQMRHLYFNLKDLFSNRKGFVILTSLLRFKNKSREFREQNWVFEGWTSLGSASPPPISPGCIRPEGGSTIPSFYFHITFT